MGGITGNFGGLIDAVQVGQLRGLQRNFFLNLQISFSSEYTARSRGAMLEKFEMSN